MTSGLTCSFRITDRISTKSPRFGVYLSASATINGKEIFDLLRDDLVALENEFGKDTVSNVGAITEIGEYLRAGGGKRIRPALLLLSARLLDYQGQGAVRLGAVVEIIHTATLVHDDIIDEAKTRRGRPAANTKWGNSKCVLAGDWLYMQAFKIAVQERNFRILDTLIELTQQMVEGELLQIEKLGKLNHAGRTFRPHFSQDGLPILRMHAAWRNSRWSYTRARSGPRQVWSRFGNGVPDRRRCSGSHCLGGCAGETGGERSA